jgi:HPt (histidine-containing phosphotransfer) domain-containing protein
MAARKNEPEPVIDRADVLERLGGDEAFLEEMLDLYSREFAAKAKSLTRAVARRDFAEVLNQGHGLKGASANLSLPGLRTAALAVEKAGERMNLAGARAGLERLKAEFARFEGSRTRR